METKPRSWADRSLVQLTLVRLREVWREKEAIFWVFVFPILLAAGWIEILSPAEIAAEIPQGKADVLRGEDFQHIAEPRQNDRMGGV